MLSSHFIPVFLKPSILLFQPRPWRSRQPRHHGGDGGHRAGDLGPCPIRDQRLRADAHLVRGPRPGGPTGARERHPQAEGAAAGGPLHGLRLGGERGPGQWAELHRRSDRWAFERHFGHLADAVIQSDLQLAHLLEEGETTIYRCRYSKDDHRTKCQALTIVSLTHSPYTTKIARIRCYTMLSTVIECQDVRPTMSAYIKQRIKGSAKQGRVSQIRRPTMTI